MGRIMGLRALALVALAVGWYVWLAWTLEPLYRPLTAPPEGWCVIWAEGEVEQPRQDYVAWCKRHPYTYR